MKELSRNLLKENLQQHRQAVVAGDYETYLKTKYVTHILYDTYSIRKYCIINKKNRER